MKTIEVQIDDKTMERLTSVAEKHHIPVPALAGAVLRHANWNRMLEDRIVGSMRDQVELEEQVLEQIMHERARRWAE
jgi:hypothetical protein